MSVAVRAVRRKKAAPAQDAGLAPKQAATAAQLLAWYDRHRRILPWRARPGQKADPYRVWLSEIMLQQTTVKAVAPYYSRFLAQWPTVEALAIAKLDDVLRAWAGLGYYARARNLHACAIVVARERGGTFPNTEAELRTLPGVGGYTAGAIAAIAFDVPAAAVDGNVERVISRLYAIAEVMPAAKPLVRQSTQALVPQQRAGDFAQALMDLGATICTPKKPACVLCPWFDPCVARQRGEQELYPSKAPKVEGRMRYGASFFVMRADDYVLVRTRPDKGLLGGMTEIPSTPWVHEFREPDAVAQAPLMAKWKCLPGVVEHAFTHFPMQQKVYVAEMPKKTSAPVGARWVKLEELSAEALPNVMRKVIAHALEKRR